jgi:hypothetical protein
MSYQFYNYFNSIKKPLNVIKINKKKHIYYLKEGIINFSVKLKQLDCQLCSKKKECDLKKCNHIYQLFNEYYNIDEYLLQFLFINDNYKKALKNEELNIDEKDLECPICLENTEIIKRPNNKIINCLNCNKFYHNKCLNKTNKNICYICSSSII